MPSGCGKRSARDKDEERSGRALVRGSLVMRRRGLSTGTSRTRHLTGSLTWNLDGWNNANFHRLAKFFHRHNSQSRAICGFVYLPRI